MQRWLGATSRSSKRTISVTCSFAMSGIAHWSRALNVPWTANAHGMFTYLMMQVPIIRAENLVVDLAVAKGIKGMNQKAKVYVALFLLLLVFWPAGLSRCSADDRNKSVSQTRVS
jgi:hypothetical protein